MEVEADQAVPLVYVTDCRDTVEQPSLKRRLSRESVTKLPRLDHNSNVKKTCGGLSR